MPSPGGNVRVAPALSVGGGGGEPPNGAGQQERAHPSKATFSQRQHVVIPMRAIEGLSFETN